MNKNFIANLKLKFVDGYFIKSTNKNEYHTFGEKWCSISQQLGQK